MLNLKNGASRRLIWRIFTFMLKYITYTVDLED